LVNAMLNPFFLQGSQTEQGLVQDLINEQLRMYGVEVHYIPRKYATEKTIIREVIQSKFDQAHPIEAYVNNYEGYGDNTTILSKFGIQATNEIELIISKERYEEYISPLLKDKANVKLTTRPKEGDLIYFPLGDRIFEIKFVEHEKPFYQLRKNYVYVLKCELFRMEQNDILDTGISEVDDVLTGISTNLDDGYVAFGSVQTLTMVGAGVTAEATTTRLGSGSIRSIIVTNRGGGYSSAPTVAISSAPSGGITGIATAVMISGIVVCTDNVNPKAKSVQEVNLVNPGLGYTVSPKIRFIGGGGSGAAATSVISPEGSIGPITLSNPGSGYTVSPSITFTGISTISAAATAVVSSAGTITAINITNAGTGYTEAPTITIGSPYLAGIGTYIFNEVITGSTSGTTARVRSWNVNTSVLEIASASGEFVSGETVVGEDSEASYMIRAITEFEASDGFSSNDDIETEADAIIDFSEGNPFGQA
tara:strand:+ start:5022 stop:6458 length:1437 start_codon:yes stop_codon:yes gene_type:complete